MRAKLTYLISLALLFALVGGSAGTESREDIGWLLPTTELSSRGQGCGLFFGPAVSWHRMLSEKKMC